MVATLQNPAGIGHSTAWTRGMGGWGYGKCHAETVRHISTHWRGKVGGRDVLEGGEGGSEGGEGGRGVWLGHPSSLGPFMVPATGGPKIFKLKYSWR